EARIDDRDENNYITAAEIEELKSFAQDSYPIAPDCQDTEAVYGAIAQSFSTDEEFQLVEDDIVGMSGKVLEGSFKIFIGAKASLSRIDRVMKSAGLVPVKKYFQPQFTASAVLYPSEAENGVALIDFGGGCTSVSVFYRNVLRHYASIPFGGINVTKDIQSESNISFRLSENLKLAFGACIPDKLQNMSEKQLLIKSGNGDMDRRLAVKYLSEIITAREEEIIRAMLYEIGASGFADKLQSGVVITGGGAQMTSLANFISELSGYNVRLGRPRLTGIINACTGVGSPSASAAVGMIKAAVNEGIGSCACLKEDFDTPAPEPEDEAQPAPTESEHKTGTLPGMMSEAEIQEKENKSREKKKKSGPGVFARWTKRVTRNLAEHCDNMLDLLQEDENKEE
ncbi:MAG: cell division FtsA domain-containing protein, partial [Candidatus Cryptobacteroides sp.]